MEAKCRTLYVLDTNVLLHDPEAIFNFEQHDDIGIPRAVLIELDSMKYGNALVNASARKAIHVITDLMKEYATTPLKDRKKYTWGTKNLPCIPLRKSKDLGHLLFLTIEDSSVLSTLGIDTTDVRILATVRAADLEVGRDTKVVFVTQDLSLRIIASTTLPSISVMEYKASPRYRGSGNEGPGLVKHKKVGGELLTAVRKRIGALGNQCWASTLGNVKALPHNTFVALDHRTKPCVIKVTVGSKGQRRFTHVVMDPLIAKTILPQSIEQACAVNLLLDPNTPLVIITGRAGSGKTLLAIAVSTHLKWDYDQILMVVPVLHEEATDRIEDATNFIVQAGKEQLVQRPDVRVVSLASIRGRSLQNTFLIIDDAQDLTPLEIKTIITRAGQNTKVVVLGNLDLISAPSITGIRGSGLYSLIAAMSGSKLCGHIFLPKTERSTLVELVIKAL